MEKNIKQHHEFLPGLEAWIKYISECRKNEGSDFDAARFTQLIDGFAPQLTAHLAEEIPTLLALDKYNIAEVKRAWGLFDKAMRNKADVVCFNQLFFWVTVDKYSGRLIRWALGMLIGLMREATDFQNFPGLYRILYITGSAGNIGLCGASIPTLCLERKGHWCSSRRRTCKISWLGIDNSSQMLCCHLWR